MKKGMFGAMLFALGLCLCSCGEETLTIKGGTETEALLLVTEAETPVSETTVPTTPETTTAVLLAVYICGEVNCPGVYEVPAGSRLYELVELAGGFTENAATEYKNLAEYVTDAEKIVIPSLSEVDDPHGAETDNRKNEETTPAGGVQNASDGRININTASARELTELPGIGNAKAEAIVSYREANGPFASIEELMNVTGIKQGIFDQLKDRIKVE